MVARLSVGIISAGSTIMALWQSVATPDPGIAPGIADHIEKLSLQGVLILAVIVLWRKLDKRDADLEKKNTAQLEAFLDNTQAMRSLKESIDKVVSAREALGNKHGR